MIYKLENKHKSNNESRENKRQIFTDEEHDEVRRKISKDKGLFHTLRMVYENDIDPGDAFVSMQFLPQLKNFNRKDFVIYWDFLDQHQDTSLDFLNPNTLKRY